MSLDTSFDFRTDSEGKDPDTASPTLRRYHKYLWSKELPSGVKFDLDITGVYLHHRSELGEFWLSSDSVIPTYSGWVVMKPILNQLPKEEIDTFTTIGYTIGGIMVFPGDRIDGEQTINVARGFNRKIADRFDLTLECIRRHYRGQSSPLGGALERYKVFFALFEDFPGYVNFFLLQDLVNDDYSAVRYFLPFEDFTTPSLPQDVAAYREYERLSIEFIKARNRRIDRWVLDAQGLRGEPDGLLGK